MLMTKIMRILETKKKAALQLHIDAYSMRALKPILFLIGPPGSGKTTVGRVLGKMWKKPVVDVDDDILEQFWGRPVSQVAQVLSPEDFIRSESMILGAALPRLPRPSILSMSGSNPMHEESFAGMRLGNISVFLDVPHDVIVGRMQKMRTDRIVGLRHKGMQSQEDVLRELLRNRHEVYKKSCDIRVKVSEDQQPTDIAVQVQDELPCTVFQRY